MRDTGSINLSSLRGRQRTIRTKGATTIDQTSTGAVETYFFTKTALEWNISRTDI